MSPTKPWPPNADQGAELIEWKQAQPALSSADKRVERILGSITDRYFAIDKNWRITALNKHAEDQPRVSPPTFSARYFGTSSLTRLSKLCLSAQ